MFSITLYVGNEHILDGHYYLLAVCLKRSEEDEGLDYRGLWKIELLDMAEERQKISKTSGLEDN